MADGNDLERCVHINCAKTNGVLLKHIFGYLDYSVNTTLFNSFKLHLKYLLPTAQIQPSTSWITSDF